MGMGRTSRIDRQNLHRMCSNVGSAWPSISTTCLWSDSPTFDDVFERNRLLLRSPRVWFRPKNHGGQVQEAAGEIQRVCLMVNSHMHLNHTVEEFS